MSDISDVEVLAKLNTKVADLQQVEYYLGEIEKLFAYSILNPVQEHFRKELNEAYAAQQRLLFKLNKERK